MCLRRVEQHSQQSDALSMLCASSVRESREMHTADSAGITYLGPHIAPRRALTNHVLSSFEITRSIQTYGKFKCCAIKNTPVNSRKFDQRLARWRNLSKCASRGRLPPVEPARSTLPRSRRSRPPALPTRPSRRMPPMPNEEVRLPAVPQHPGGRWRSSALQCLALGRRTVTVCGRAVTLFRMRLPRSTAARGARLSLPCLS